MIARLVVVPNIKAEPQIARPIIMPRITFLRRSLCFASVGVGAIPKARPDLRWKSHGIDTSDGNNPDRCSSPRYLIITSIAIDWFSGRRKYEQTNRQNSVVHMANLPDSLASQIRGEVTYPNRVTYQAGPALDCNVFVQRLGFLQAKRGLLLPVPATAPPDRSGPPCSSHRVARPGVVVGGVKALARAC